MQLAGNHTWRHAWVSCPFLEARGNLEDASTALSAHSRVRLRDAERLYRMSRLGLIAAIPGKGLTNGLLLRRSVWRSRGRMNVWQVIKGFFFPDRTRRYAQWPYLCTHVETCHERKKIDFELYSGKLDGTVIDAIGTKLSGSFVRALSDWYQVDYGDFVEKNEWYK